MTRKRVELGAPSLAGRVAELIAKAFAGRVYPVTVEAVNRMPHDITLSEVKGLYLRGITVSDGSNKKVVQIESEDQFIRLASSVQQIAALNGHEYVVMTIEMIDEGEQSSESESEVDLDPGPESTEQSGDESGNGDDDSGNDDDKIDHSDENSGANTDDDKEGKEPSVGGESTLPHANEDAKEANPHKKGNSKKSGKSHANSIKSGG